MNNDTPKQRRDNPDKKQTSAAHKTLKSKTRTIKTKRSKMNSFFYKKYLNNVNVNVDMSGEGDSPFADGKLTFDAQGNFRCTISNLKGDVFEFLKRYYGLTEYEARRIYLFDTLIHIYNNNNKYIDKDMEEYLDAWRASAILESMKMSNSDHIISKKTASSKQKR